MPARQSRRRGMPGAAIAAAATIAAVMVLGGCSAGHQADAVSDSDHVSSAVMARQQSLAETVRHWGSFFDSSHAEADTRPVPVPLTLPGPVAQVGTSNSTEYALLTNGSLYAWGLGGQGELGNGMLTSSFRRAVRVYFPPGVKIAWIPTDVMPFDTALAVDTRGHVWGWGDNAIGELCLGNHQIQPTPVRLPFTHVTAVAGAADHDLYDAGGTVYACGQNVDGDLGDGKTSNTSTPVKVARLDGHQVVKLVASFANSGALLSNGQYWNWGYNGDGQLGDGHPRRWSDVPVLAHLRAPVTQVALGGSFWGNGQTLVLLSDGSLWAWGSNYAYQLGIGTRGWHPRPVQFRAPPGVTYTSLATGSATSYAISATGNVYAWGVSHVGQAGYGSWGVVSAPVVVASGASLISATANNVVISFMRKPAVSRH